MPRSFVFIKEYIAHPTSPSSVGSIFQLPDCLTEQAGKRLGETHVWKTQGGAVTSITYIYSLAFLFDCTGSCSAFRNTFFSILVAKISCDTEWSTEGFSLMSTNKRYVGPVNETKGSSATEGVYFNSKNIYAVFAWRGLLSIVASQRPAVLCVPFRQFVEEATFSISALLSLFFFSKPNISCLPQFLAPVPIARWLKI